MRGSDVVLFHCLLDCVFISSPNLDTVSVVIVVLVVRHFDFHDIIIVVAAVVLVVVIAVRGNVLL